MTLDLSFLDLRELDFFASELKYVNFEGADLRGAIIDKNYSINPKL